MPPTRRPREDDDEQTLTDAQVFDAAPVAMWATDLQQRLVAINHQALGVLRAVTGQMELARDHVLGRRAGEILPSAVARPFEQSDAMVRETRSRSTSVQHVQTVAGVELWYDIHKQPWIAPGGEMLGVVGMARQIARPEVPAPAPPPAPSPRTEPHLRHAMTMIVSLIQLMQRSPGCDRPTLQSLEHRVAVISHFEDVLRTAAQPVELGEALSVLRGLSCRNAGDKLRFEGPTAYLRHDATVPATLCLHELLHNSARHGALSSRGGDVAIRWDRRSNGSLAIHWQETCDTPIDPTPFQHGFGLSLLHGLIVHDLDGRCDLDLAGDGLTAELVLGARALVES